MDHNNNQARTRTPRATWRQRPTRCFDGIDAAYPIRSKTRAHTLRIPRRMSCRRRQYSSSMRCRGPQSPRAAGTLHKCRACLVTCMSRRRKGCIRHRMRRIRVCTHTQWRPRNRAPWSNCPRCTRNKAIRILFQACTFQRRTLQLSFELQLRVVLQSRTWKAPNSCRALQRTCVSPPRWLHYRTLRNNPYCIIRVV